MNEVIKEDYNLIPVYYCKHCLSLRIKCDAPIDYCDVCGSTDIESCSIEEYDNLHLAKFGSKKFLK
jgi:hypothetical protein